MIVPLIDADADTSGGKAAPLGVLLRAGLPVPDGFVVPFDAHRAAARGQSLPAGLLDALGRGLHGLGDPPVAVRSSAADEDSGTASAAGQHESVLAVFGASAVGDAVRSCWASLHSPRARSYRDARGRGHSSTEPAMAVLVQRLVDADVAGVMFTPTHPRDTVEIEASWGLGPSVAGGTVTPDRYTVHGDGSVTTTVADKRTRLDRRGTALVTHDVPPADRRRPVLDDATARGLAQLGHQVSALLGSPQDIEWAIAGGDVWLVQSRPITAALPAPATLPTAPAATPTTLTGTPGSFGNATGSARTVRGPHDFPRVHAGDILICPYTDPSWTPLLRIAAGVVTETGGLLSHAAIVARERNIPAVLGITNATARINDAATVTIDGAAGTVTITSP
ncbi:PEP/pyruvate-binding domain-containing protein [Phytoactinopolyspora limicola]|uniref:PEP/pyruvate-binding domain-containing protein n=1 Tax=Phytoactinopolyspora limicola TaxID=2715536 RepID=UPI001408B8B4|nr:PEP/pyruvate-binding domain-containing protein [Phytoactinopolyspora limicola]